MFTLSIPRVRSVSWIVEKVLKFAQQFSRHGKCWKIEGKSWKNGKRLLFLKGTTCPSQVKFFSCLSNLIQSRLHVMEKAFFLRFFKFSVDHLFDKLMFFAKKSGWSLELWIKICTNPVCRIPTRKGIWYSVDTSPIWLSVYRDRRGAAQFRFVTEIVPKSPFLSVNRSPIR